MKGKGERGSVGGGSGGASKFLDDSCPLQYPNLKPVDHVKNCPHYTSILSRQFDGDDCLAVQEIEHLQADLETLSASVVKRMLLIQSELNILNATPADKGKEKAIGTPLASASTISSPGDPGTPGGSGAKRVGKGKMAASSSGSSEERPAKRMRTDSGRATYAQPVLPPLVSKGKGKVQLASKQLDPEQLESPRPALTPTLPTVDAVVPTARPPKNMTPGRFWAMVEPYCAPITSEDIRYIEDQIKTCEDIGEHMKVPALGKHYAEKWAEEDLQQEQRDGGKVGERRKSAMGNGCSNNVSMDAAALIKRIEDHDDDFASPFGPLTQRLIQGLLEENIITSLDDATMISEADAVEAATISPKSLAKQLHLGNTATLERRIKRELEEVGILGCSDDDKFGDSESGEDEILSELKRKQAELKSLSQQNSAMFRKLLSRAKDEMIQQELRSKMSAADSEVMDAYRRVQVAKSKKKALTKKEKEMFYKSLRDRDVIVKQLVKPDFGHE